MSHITCQWQGRPMLTISKFLKHLGPYLHNHTSLESRQKTVIYIVLSNKMLSKSVLSFCLHSQFIVLFK